MKSMWGSIKTYMEIYEINKDNHVINKGNP